MTALRAALAAPVWPGFPADALRRAFASPWGWSVASQALSSGGGLLVSVVAARLLGVAGFGEYVLVHAGTVILSGLQYQLVAGPMSTLSGGRARSAGYFAGVGRAALAAALLAGLLAGLYALVLTRGGEPRWGLALAALVFATGFVLQDGAKRILFATGRPRAAFACEAARHGLFVPLAALAVLATGASAAALLAAAGLAALLVAAPVLIGFLRAPSRPGVVRAAIAQHWRLGRWLILVALASTAHEQFVTILAGSLIGDAAAAGLRGAYVVLGPMLVLAASLENVVPRRAAAHLREAGRPALRAYLGRVGLAVGLPITAACLVVALAGGSVMRLVLGESFGVFAPVVAVMAMVPPVVIARDIGTTYLRTLGDTRIVAAAFGLSAAATLAAIHPLIVAHGVVGAALAVVLGHAVSASVVLGRVVLDGARPSRSGAARPGGPRTPSKSACKE